MTTLAERVNAKIDRTGEHHVWLGATDARGCGVVSVGGRLTTV